ncbi:hypothetical protein PAPYR_6018 [Paratrimastix pyriformis]|uniref:Dynein heavy chain tail domain-containing protein n=1 Tax=Paratrimastix pyriformis TaxID=342808 RepID=A0ABQ8UIS2_9EUKA|nr:hypothetical protein PAPYR_6018 [Paratrimastix pyriformis]
MCLPSRSLGEGLDAAPGAHQQALGGTVRLTSPGRSPVLAGSGSGGSSEGLPMALDEGLAFGEYQAAVDRWMQLRAALTGLRALGLNTLSLRLLQRLPLTQRSVPFVAGNIVPRSPPPTLIPDVNALTHLHASLCVTLERVPLEPLLPIISGFLEAATELRTGLGPDPLNPRTMPAPRLAAVLSLFQRRVSSLELRLIQTSNAILGRLRCPSRAYRLTTALQPVLQARFHTQHHTVHPAINIIADKGTSGQSSCVIPYADVDEKAALVMRLFGDHVTAIGQLYARTRPAATPRKHHEVALFRNTPPMTASLLHTRHLLRRLRAPLRLPGFEPALAESRREGPQLLSDCTKLARSLQSEAADRMAVWRETARRCAETLSGTPLMRRMDGELERSSSSFITQLHAADLRELLAERGRLRMLVSDGPLRAVAAPLLRHMDACLAPGLVCCHHHHMHTVIAIWTPAGPGMVPRLPNGTQPEALAAGGHTDHAQRSRFGEFIETATTHMLCLMPACTQKFDNKMLTSDLFFGLCDWTVPDCRTTLSWRSIGLAEFIETTSSVGRALQTAAELTRNADVTMEEVSTLRLYDLPTEPVALPEFVEMQREALEQRCNTLDGLSHKGAHFVQAAVLTLSRYAADHCDGEDAEIPQAASDDLLASYERLFAASLQRCVSNGLRELAGRLQVETTGSRGAVVELDQDCS